MLIVISGPSGAGKTPLTYSVTSCFDNISRIKSYTTRQIRNKEVSGTYVYLTVNQFLEKIKEGFFLEYNRVHKDQQYYGTSLESYKGIIEQGKVAIKDLDVDSYKKIKNNPELDVIGIYATVKDRAILFDRLRERGESEKTIQIRLHDRVDYENAQSSFFDYVIYTDDFGKAVKQLHSIIEKEFKKRNIKYKRQKYVLNDKPMF